MIDHLGITVSDYDRSRAFYDGALAPLGVSLVMEIPDNPQGVKGGGYGDRGKPEFWIQQGAFRGDHAHVALAAKSRADVDAFYRAAIAAGGRDNGGPGVRAHYHPNYYGAFVFDPDGHNIEAVCHTPGDAMSLDNRPVYSGGCQCGAVRFRVEGALGDASVCHCRMCQKAFGAFYAPLVSVRGARLEWTRGEPKRFRSSNVARRGFCAECGTPLTYEAPDGVALAIGAFDHPEEIAPVVAWGVEAKLPYADDVPGLPGQDTLADQEATSFLAKLVSFQHPDHDTDSWPPEGTA